MTSEQGVQTGIDYTVFAQLGALLTFMILLFVGSYVSVVHTQHQQIHNIDTINSAGLQRMLIQQFTREISTVIAAHATKDWKTVLDARKAASRTETLIETNFKGFLEGGGVVLDAYDDRRVDIDPLPLGEASAAIIHAREEWKTLKRMATTALQADTKSVTDSPRYTELSNQADQTVRAQNDAIFSVAETIAESTKTTLRIQQVVLITSLMTFLIILSYTYFRVFRPVNTMYKELRRHRDHLETRINAQMQEYTDKLEEARFEQDIANKKLQQEAKTIKLFERVTVAINEADTVAEAMQICIDEICSYTGWPVGHAYTFCESGGLVSMKIWHLKDPEKFETFKNISELTVVAPGIDLPGRIYKSGQPAWIKDIAEDQNFPRAGVADEVGIRIGVGFPVLVKKEVAAVLEFFAGEVRDSPQDLIKIMSNIGTQLGRIVERDQIEEARREADRANQIKSEFLANMSHELRTPLNSIIGLSKMLADDAETKSEEQDMNKIVHKSASCLLEIVNDILDLSKIEAGGVALESIGFDLKEIVATVTATLAPVVSANGVFLNYSYPHDGLPYLKGDPVRVRRILTNLVGNAVKYTSEGRIDVIVDHEPLEGDKILVSCAVIDTGMGIPDDKLDVIFQKFSQVDETTTRKFGGTGLGLAITKELVEMMGGTLGVESEIGKGSRFWFKIPFETSENIHDDLQYNKRGEGFSEDPGGEKIPAGKARILVAEDHELNQVFIKKLLGRMGFEHYDVVENGVLALNAYKESPYDFILMDCHMPEKNGYQATEDIRALEEEKGEGCIPIIALTADAMAGTRKKCLDAGMSDYITKPINSGEFRDLLGRWFVFPDTKQEKKGTGVDSNAEGIIDFSALKEYADTQEEIKGFCHTFFVSTERALENLEGQCTDGENETWTEITHRIKGSAGMIGAIHLEKLCDEAQHRSVATDRERKDMLKGIRDAYENVKRIFNERLLGGE